MFFSQKASIFLGQQATLARYRDISSGEVTDPGWQRGFLNGAELLSATIDQHSNRAS
jgi:hypothetical protein